MASEGRSKAAQFRTSVLSREISGVIAVPGLNMEN